MGYLNASTGSSDEDETTISDKRLTIACVNNKDAVASEQHYYSDSNILEKIGNKLKERRKRVTKIFV